METIRARLLILGSGPAGWTAALYAARANLQPLVVAGIQPGGQLTTTTDVDNWPADINGVQGPELMERFERHARRFGAQLVQDHIEQADLSRRPFILSSAQAVYECDALIIAAGATAKYLGLESEKQFLGKGVSACATCDGFFFRNQTVLVAGGGNTAVEESLYLANIASKVLLVHRRDALRAEKIMQDKLFTRAAEGKIELMFNYTLAEILGDDKGVNGARLQSTVSEQMLEVAVDGVFIAIGHQPNTRLFEKYLRMENGYIKTNHGAMMTATNVKGVFAAGDVQDSIYRQAVTSAGSGCMAALDAIKYLDE